MHFYMLRNKNSGLYFKRGWSWTSREHASVWTTLAGPRGTQATIKRYYYPRPPEDTEIVIFEGKEV